jgi:hypothetical protein
VDHGVDIISMSFGWSEEIPSATGLKVVSKAISRAIDIRNNKILLFAAASNFGANQPELFPGTHPFVTPIRATDHLGAFKRLNPPARDMNAFGTLGWKVPSAPLHVVKKDEVGLSGTSAATPIAAGIAALILGRARFRLHTETRAANAPRLEKLWEMPGMEKMFKELSIETDYLYLSMNAILQDKEDGKGADRRMDIACS